MVRRHSSKGITRSLKPTVACPRCPVTGVTIRPGDGAHIVVQAKHVVHSEYVHKWVAWVFSYHDDHSLAQGTVDRIELKLAQLGWG